MVMVVNSRRWCLGFLGIDGFPDQLKLLFQIHCNEELRIQMLSQWLFSHHVRGVAWRSPQGSWLDWRAILLVQQFNRQMERAEMKCTIREVILEMRRTSDERIH